MIKKVDWDSLVVSVMDRYTEIASDLSILICKGNYNRSYELRFILLTRYVKVIDSQNVKDDDIQLSDGFKDYDEVEIENALDRINIISNSTFNIPIVYNEILDTVTT